MILIHGGKYEVHPDGRIINAKTQAEVYGTIDQRYGFIMLKLVDENGEHVRYVKHRLIANLFVENPRPDAYIKVHHKNGDKTDCRAENLYWGTKLPKFDPPLAAYDLDGNLVKTYDIWHDLKEDGHHQSNVRHCLDGVNRTYHQLIWQWYEGEDKIEVDPELKTKWLQQRQGGSRYGK